MNTDGDASQRTFDRLRGQLRELADVTNVLTSETPGNQLWPRIVKNARRLLACDGCTFYRVVDGMLVSEIVLTDSLGLVAGASAGDPDEFPPRPLFRHDGNANDETLALSVFHSGQVLNVADVNLLPDVMVRGVRAFDAKLGYATQSMLTIPVQFRSNPPDGVLQLINAKNYDGDVIAFDSHCESVACALAALIALSIRLG